MRVRVLSQLFYKKVRLKKSISQLIHLVLAEQFGRTIYSLRHRKSDIRGFIHELFELKTRTSE